MKKLNPFFIGICICMLLGFTPCQAEKQDQLLRSIHEKDLVRAETYLTSFKNDSASIILLKIATDLQEQNQLDSSFGLRVQLAEGTFLEQDQQDERAIRELLHVQEASREKELWEIFVKSSLVLANLYEKMGLEENTLINLHRAQSAVRNYRLDHLYPMFAVRISSYHRVFTENIDSSLYYAREALRTAPKFRLDLEEAIGNLLMGILLQDSSYTKSIDHYRAAGKLYLKLEDYTGYSYINHGISKLHFKNHNPLLALAYNDAALASAVKAITLGHERHVAIASTYRLRGEIYGALGRLDSALYYLNKGYQMELDYIRTSANERVVEIDARFNDEKKVQKIEEQNRQIQFEKVKINRLMTISLIALLFIGILFYYYWQLRETNRIIREQAERLKDIHIAKSRFFANVSHELRTPLTLILGPIHTLLKEHQPSEEQAKLLRIANQNVHQLERLVNNVLDLKKFEMNKMRVNESPTTLSSFFRQYFAQFESLAERKRIKYTYDVEVEKKALANIDQEKCRRILYNLLSNAFKFTPALGWIQAEVSLVDNELQLRVADSGCGIHPDDLPFLFDRFFQTKQPDKSAEGGTGIGLALCREYVRLFWGEITVDSILGEGSVFKVVFPVEILGFNSTQTTKDYPTPTEGIAIPFNQLDSDRSECSRTSKPTILVVEDNPDLQDYLQLILRNDYHVAVVENGKEALHWLFAEDNLPSLILSDLMMPVMDGYQLLEKLKSEETTRHIPVIMLTARVDIRDKLKALRIGVDDYLNKPFQEEELLVRIENLLFNQASRSTEVPSETHRGKKESVMTSTDQNWLEVFEDYIHQHLSDDMLSVPSLACEFAMSESTLLRRLKRLTGLSPIQYIQEIRLDAARRLLENRPGYSIARVAEEIGYSDVRSFSRVFKKRFGRLPSSFYEG